MSWIRTVGKTAQIEQEALDDGSIVSNVLLGECHNDPIQCGAPILRIKCCDLDHANALFVVLEQCVVDVARY